MKNIRWIFVIIIVAVAIIMIYGIIQHHPKESEAKEIETIVETVDFSQYALGDLNLFFGYTIAPGFDVDEVMQPKEKKAQEFDYKGEKMLVVYENKKDETINSYNAMVEKVLTVNPDGSTEDFEMVLERN